MKCLFCKTQEATAWFSGRQFCQECFTKLKRFARPPIQRNSQSSRSADNKKTKLEEEYNGN